MMNKNKKRSISRYKYDRVSKYMSIGSKGFFDEKGAYNVLHVTLNGFIYWVEYPFGDSWEFKYWRKALSEVV